MCLYPIIVIHSATMRYTFISVILLTSQFYFLHGFMPMTNINVKYEQTQGDEHLENSFSSLKDEQGDFEKTMKGLSKLVSEIKNDTRKVQSSTKKAETIKNKLSERLLEVSDLTKQLQNVSLEVKQLNQSLAEKSEDEEKACPTSKGFERVGREMCIKVVNVSQSWENGKKTCEDDGAKLITLQSEQEQEAITDYLYNHDDYKSRYRYYVGMYRKAHAFFWLEKSSFVGTWQRRPSRQSSFNCCLLGKNGLRSTICMITHHFICRY